MINNLNQLARKIIETNQYMTIASIDGKNPWAAPVVYAYDDNFNLYYISLPDSKHAKNISFNANVTVAIFDSHQPFGEGVGLQIEGTIKIVPLSNVFKVTTIYMTRNWPHSNNIIKTYLEGFKKLLQNTSYRAYQFTPTKVWMNDPNSKIDIRVEVHLKQ